MGDPQTTQQGPRRARRWVRWVRDLLILLAIVVAVQWWQARDLAGGRAPPLVGLLVDGSPYQLETTEGPVIVHFWATWCPVCRLEQDNIASIAADGRVVTVATSSGSTEDVAAYLEDQGLAMPVVLDERGDIAQAWGVNGVPATFIVDRGGEIRSAHMGYATELGLRLRLWWAQW